MSHRVSNNPSISIELADEKGRQNNYYRPNEYIKGTIHLTVPPQHYGYGGSSNSSSPLSPTWTHLELQVIGEEQTLIDNPDAIGDIRRQSKKIVYHAKMTLESFDDVHNPVVIPATPGTYEYPFEAKLPPDIPSTMMCQSKNDFDNLIFSTCSISYKVVCQLHRISEGKYHPTTMFSSCHDNETITAEREFQVFNTTYAGDGKVNEIVYDNESVRDRHDLFYCGMLPRGYMNLGIKLNKKKLAKGEAFDIDVIFKNRTLRDTIDSLSIQVRENIVWKAEHCLESKSRILCHEIIPGTDVTPNRSTLLNSNNNSNNNKKNKKNKNKTKNNNMTGIRLRIPKEANGNYIGHLAKITHDVRIIAVTTASCVTNPEIVVPITIESRYVEEEDDDYYGWSSHDVPPVKKFAVASSLPKCQSQNGGSGVSDEPMNTGFPERRSIFTACLG